MVCAISNATWAVTPLEGRMEVLETLSSRPASALKTALSSVRTCPAYVLNSFFFVSTNLFSVVAGVF